MLKQQQSSKEEELVKLRIEQNKAVIRKFLGQDMFNEVYKFLIKQRSEGVEDVLVSEERAERVDCARAAAGDAGQQAGARLLLEIRPNRLYGTDKRTYLIGA